MSHTLRFAQCKPTYDPEFDLNYSAPGSVVQDPTRAPGNLIMIYEAENHCPGGVWQEPFYASVGIARSSDNGKTWPAPAGSELGGGDQYVVLKRSDPEPANAEQPPVALGDALPSAYVDGKYLYVTYTPSGPGHDCVSYQKDASGTPEPTVAARYYSTATSLGTQNWTEPQMIENSQYPTTTECSAAKSGRGSTDGILPSCHPATPRGIRPQQVTCSS
jgi:hypothetical protein